MPDPTITKRSARYRARAKDDRGMVEIRLSVFVPESDRARFEAMKEEMKQAAAEARAQAEHNR